MKYRVYVLGMLCGLLGCFVAFRDMSRGKVEQITYTLPALTTLKSIRVQRTGQTDTDLERGPQGWLVNGGPSVLDTTALATLTKVLSKPVSMDLKVGQPPDLSKFGLGPHSITITLGGTEKFHFRVGKVVNDQLTFIQDMGTGTVYRARANLRRAFDRSAIEWRQRNLFDVPFKTVTSLLAKSQGGVLWHVERSGDSAPWKFLHPKGMMPGEDEVGAVLNTLVTAKAIKFDDRKKSLKERSRLIFETRDKTRYGLALGPRAQGGALYARVLRQTSNGLMPKGPIVILPRYQAIFLEPKAADLRNRRVFDFKPGDVRGMAFLGAQELKLDFESEQWTLSIGDEKVAVDRRRADDFVQSLTSLRALAIPKHVPNDVFDEPMGRAVVRLADNRLYTVTVGRAFGAGRYLRREDAPERVMVVSRTSIRLLGPKRSDFEKQSQGAR